ncbi:hypothetical protein [Actinacidiphila sp. ITFR-21]|uniref:hypothetical protein n=1 Tax=Actinacidiphila sp. ITFR-21 TaxID=3075199 RepID=UPI00288B67B8|nr:hypothetical protein [Streptomyces sp. ITFR-21]WNI15580.1 hypothetical protein RLT57_08595 [Streptomyces sp. ITFR-21]
MAVISPPAWLQAGSYPARTDRLSAITSQLWYSGFAIDESTPLRPRQGVRPSYQGYQLKVRAAGTPNMTVIVSAGMGFIDNHDINGYGTYTVVNDADVTLNVAAAGGAGQYRKDSVCISVYDAETAGAVNSAVLEIIQGPYASSAGATVRGTLPPNSIVLADLAIAPSQTSVAAGGITDVRNFTASLGGIAPIPSTIAPGHPHPGQMWYEADLDRFRYGDSTGTVKSLLPEWQTYTPTWTAATTNPTLGSGTLVGRYAMVGKTCKVKIELATASNTGFGSGQYSWALPFTASAAGTGTSVGAGHGITAGNARWPIQALVTAAGSTVAVYSPIGSGDCRLTVLGSAQGMGSVAWATGQTMRLAFDYEVA